MLIIVVLAMTALRNNLAPGQRGDYPTTRPPNYQPLDITARCRHYFDLALCSFCPVDFIYVEHNLIPPTPASLVATGAYLKLKCLLHAVNGGLKSREAEKRLSRKCGITLNGNN